MVKILYHYDKQSTPSHLDSTFPGIYSNLARLGNELVAHQESLHWLLIVLLLLLDSY